MSIADELTRIKGAKASLKTSITNKGVEVPDTALIDAYPALVDQIITGGGGGGSDVLFVDYDGTVLYSYSKDEFLGLTSLPDNPDHTADNLTADGWNWSLDDAQAQVNEYGELIVGQTYHTTDGINYFDLKFPSADTTVTLKWSQTVANGVVIDWGDGSATETNSGTGTVSLEHTYAAYSEATLTMQSVAGNTLTIGVVYSLFNDVQQKYLVSAKLASGVKLGSYAFYNCYALASITIPNSVTSIGDSVFYNCAALQSITIPNSVTSIGNRAFAYCPALQSITIPNSVTSIVEGAFYNCYALQSITLPNSVTSIGDNIFNSCTALQSITLPNSVTSIGSYAFGSCTALQSITIPNSVTSIGNYAFYNCRALASIAIPNSVTSIGNYAFSGCYNITLDLSTATAVPTASGDPFGSTSNVNHPAILVPSALLSDFQSATNWSTYANFMKGV